MPAKALIAAFEKKNPNIKIKLELGPQGTELDNMVKTRLATQEMTDVFAYNAGSLFQALKPESQLQPVNDEPWVENLDDAFVPTVSANDQVYGAPVRLRLRRGHPLQQEGLREARPRDPEDMG